MDNEFRSFLTERIKERGALAKLAKTSGIKSPVIGHWARGETRPSLANLRRIAPALGVPYEDLMKMCGYLPGDHAEPPQVPISIRQRTVSENYERWMAVMGPRMGADAAHQFYWDQHLHTSAMMVAAVEAALNAIPTPPETTAVSEAQPAAVSDGVSAEDEDDNGLSGTGGSALSKCYRMTHARVDRVVVSINRRLAA